MALLSPKTHEKRPPKPSTKRNTSKLPSNTERLNAACTEPATESLEESQIDWSPSRSPSTIWKHMAWRCSLLFLASLGFSSPCSLSFNASLRAPNQKGVLESGKNTNPLLASPWVKQIFRNPLSGLDWWFGGLGVVSIYHLQTNPNRTSAPTGHAGTSSPPP